MQEHPPLLTVDEVAIRLRVGVETVRRLIRRGELPALNLGGRTGYRIEEKDLQEFIKKKKGETRLRPVA